MQLSILLLTIDRAAADSLTTALSKPGHGVTVVSDPVELFAQAAGYSLVIIDRVAPPLTVGSIVEEPQPVVHSHAREWTLGETAGGR